MLKFPFGKNKIIGAQTFKFRIAMNFVKDAECLGPYFLALTELCTSSSYRDML
jgi:hypothetical protein